MEFADFMSRVTQLLPATPLEFISIYYIIMNVY